jgi:diketogulonate reductase-like aldo/keto reductase
MTTQLTLKSTIPLPGNLRIPQLGFGVYRSPPELTSRSVTHALEAGYRHIDTAQIYRNEAEVGRAVRDFTKNTGIGRDEVWITTKLRDARGKFPKKLDDVPMLLRESVERISGTTVEEGGYVDLFLIHSPYAGPEGRAEQWRGLEGLKRDGGTRSLGVSN